MDFSSTAANNTTFSTWNLGKRRALWGWRALLVRHLRRAAERLATALYRNQQRSRARYYRRHGIDVPIGYEE